MKQRGNNFWALLPVTALLAVGIMDGKGARVHGQTREKPVPLPGTGRDPFSLPPGIRLLTKTDPGGGANTEASAAERAGPSPKAKPADMPPPAFTLKAILMTDHLRLASIDQQIVAVGDSIQGEKVLEILADRVILGSGGKKRVLVLSQSPIRLTVDERQGGIK